MVIVPVPAANAPTAVYANTTVRASISANAFFNVFILVTLSSPIRGCSAPIGAYVVVLLIYPSQRGCSLSWEPIDLNVPLALLDILVL